MDKEKIKQMGDKATAAFNQTKEKFLALPKKKQIIVASSAGGGVVILILLIVCLLFCGNSDIKLVRNGFLEFDKSISVSDALKKNMKDIQWTLSSNKAYVDVTGVWDSDYFKRNLIDVYDETKDKLASARISTENKIAVEEKCQKRNYAVLNDLYQKRIRISRANREFIKLEGNCSVIRAFPVKGDIVQMRFMVSRKDKSVTFFSGKILTPDKKDKLNGMDITSDHIRNDLFPKVIYCNEKFRSELYELQKLMRDIQAMAQ